MTDRVHDRWSRGEPALNAWLTLEGPASARVLAEAGFDAVTVDLQHGSAAEDDLGAIAAAIVDGGAVPFARLRWNDPGSVMRALDLGVLGVIAPMVDSRLHAEDLVRACRYPPAGARSYGPIHGAFGSGREQTEAANRAVLAFAQIESAEGLANVTDIASTPGLDGVYVGPADLSLALGLETFADLSDLAMLEALDRVLEATTNAGIVPGIHAPGSERAAAMIARGFRFIGAADDVELLGGAAAERLRRVRRTS